MMGLKSQERSVYLILMKIIFLVLLTSIPISISRANVIQETDIVIDGLIKVGEYAYQQVLSDGDFILHWKHVSNEIYFALEGKTTGWVAIGINPSFMMLNADMYFGWVYTNGSVAMIDAYAIEPTGSHPPDTEQGGTNDILEYNGSENEQTTIIEFKRLLTTPDSSYDNPLPLSGTVKMIWALGASDSFEAPHVKRGSLKWGLEGSSSFNADFSQPFLLGLSLLLTLSGLLIFVDSKERQAQKQKNEI
ncbi:MAG: DOMON domain-containing protein [Candidatus Hodarchaeota archaeon]